MSRARYPFSNVKMNTGTLQKSPTPILLGCMSEARAIYARLYTSQRRCRNACQPHLGLSIPPPPPPNRAEATRIEASAAAQSCQCLGLGTCERRCFRARKWPAFPRGVALSWKSEKKLAFLWCAAFSRKTRRCCFLLPRCAAALSPCRPWRALPSPGPPCRCRPASA